MTEEDRAYRRIYQRSLEQARRDLHNAECQLTDVQCSDDDEPDPFGVNALYSQIRLAEHRIFRLEIELANLKGKQ